MSLTEELKKLSLGDWTIIILMSITIMLFLCPLIFVLIWGNPWYFALFFVSWIPSLAMFLLTALVGSLMKIED